MDKTTTLRKWQTAQFENAEGQTIALEVTDPRRGMAAICSDPSRNFADPYSYTGRFADGSQVQMEWGHGGEQAYTAYCYGGYHVIGGGYHLVAVDVEGIDLTTEDVVDPEEALAAFDAARPGIAESKGEMAYVARAARQRMLDGVRAEAEIEDAQRAEVS